MKNIVFLMLMTVLFAACSNDKEAAVAKEQPISETPGRLEELSKIDTSQFFKEFPQARDINNLGPKYQIVTPEYRMYAFKSRVFFGMSRNDENSIGAKLLAMINKNSNEKYEKMLELPQIKFKEGSTELEGMNTDEWKILSYLSYVPVADNLEFKAKLNVNSTDPALRKQRLETLKTALKESKADIDRFTFEENATPQTKEGILSLEIEKRDDVEQAISKRNNQNGQVITPKK